MEFDESEIYFALLLEFKQGDIPLLEFTKRKLGLDESVTMRRAREQDFPFPIYRLGGQKSPWFVNARDAAKWMAPKLNSARTEYKKAFLSH